MPSKRPEGGGGGLWVHAAILGGAYLVAFLLLAAGLWAVPEVRRFFAPAPPEERAAPGRAEGGAPAPAPVFVPRKEMSVARLFNGVTFRSRIETEQGGQAALERKEAESYMAELLVRVRVPRAADTIEGLRVVNPEIGSVLPGLEAMLARGRVSNFFNELYELKVRMVKGSAERLDALVSRHNFYDCDTILELEHPLTRRKALLIQSEMDVVTDGTDPDRTAKTVGVTTTFQPFTSYRWPRRTKNPNPFAADRRARLAKVEAELGAEGTTAARKQELRALRDQLRLEIADLERFSFLVAHADPFIVLPGFIYRQRGHPFHPKLGDFAVVIHGKRLYPAIFGDTGPSYKMGEASLRICQEINPRSTPLSRPVSALEVTYLVFPGTANPVAGPPDYALWRRRCEELLREIGGYNGTLHEWEDVLKPAPTPAPTPSPSPAPAPSPSVSPSESSEPTGPAVPSGPEGQPEPGVTPGGSGAGSGEAGEGGVPASSPSPSPAPGAPAAGGGGG